MDLRPEEFTLLLDGSPHTIEAVELQVAGETSELWAEAEPAREPQESAGRIPIVSMGRKFVLFFDGLNTERGIRDAITEAARHFVEESLSPGDQAMVLGLGKHLKVYEEFTDDKGATQAALGALEADEEIRWVAETHTRTNLSRLDDMGVPLFDLSGECVACEAIAHSFALEDRNRILHTLDSLRALIASLHLVRGRKHLILFSEGFVANPGDIYGRPLDRSLEPEFIQLIREAAAAQVLIYTVNALGLPGSDPVEGLLERKFSDSMAAFAVGTGGEAFSGSNRFEKAMSQLHQGSQTFYVIAFTPQGPPDGKYHSIEVRISRKRTRVRSKQGFIWHTPEQISEREHRSAYVAPELFQSFPLSLEILSYLGEKGASMLEFVMEVPEENLLFLPQQGSWVGQIETGFTVVTGLNEVIDQFSRGVRTRFSPEQFQAPGNLTFVVHRQIPPGEYGVVAVVRDLGTGNMGAVRSRIQVPVLDDGPMAMSSLFMGEGRKLNKTIILDEGERRGPGIPILSGQRVFRRTNQPLCSWFIYHPQRAPDTGEAKVRVQGFILTGNETLRHLPEVMHEFAADEQVDRIPVGMRLSLADLNPGDYLLRVKAWDDVAGTQAVQETDFKVR